jgi:pimeloyl-ACP methyl ester carboxylesterase
MRVGLARIAAIAIMSCLSGSSLAQDAVRIVPENPTACATKCDRIAVLFFHGITGTKSTWQNENGAYWPDLLAGDPQLGAKLDIYRVDYDSFLFASNADVETVQRELQAKLDKLLFEEKKYKKIVLICHSLGGIFCRRQLVHVKLRYGHKYLSLLGLTITLGTPLRGSELTTFARTFSNNPQFRVLQPDRVNDFLKFLQNVTEDYDAKRDDRCGRITYLAAYEMKPVPAVGLVVPQASATLLSTRSKGFDLDHVALAKPPARQDDPGSLYGWVKHAIMACDKGETMCTKLQDSCEGRMPPWMAP